MSPKEKYEIIIKTVEDMIEMDEVISDREMAEAAFCKATEYIDDRSKNTIFSFLMNTTIIKYISERRLMASYRVLLKERDDKKAYRQAYELSGTGSTQAFATKFKSRFGLSPIEAHRLNKESLYEAAPTWESLSNEELKDEKMNNKKFGVSIDQFRLIQEALNLESFYGLNEYESDLAYSIYSEGKASLEESFQYVGSYLMMGDESSRDERLKEDLQNSDVQHLFFDFKLSFDEIFNVLLMKYLGEIKHNIQDYKEEFIKGCACYPIEEVWTEERREKFEDIYKYYKDNTDSKYTIYDFCMFIFYLDYIPMASAVKFLTPGIKSQKELINSQIAFMDSLYSKSEETYYEPNWQDESPYNPEVWDPDYVSELEIAEDELEEEWIEEAMDSREVDEWDEDEIFDMDEFISICESLSELTEEELDEKSEPRRTLTIHNNLDVKTYWENKKEYVGLDVRR